MKNHFRKKMLYFTEDIPYFYAQRKIYFVFLWVEILVKKENIKNIENTKTK